MVGEERDENMNQATVFRCRTCKEDFLSRKPLRTTC